MTTRKRQKRSPANDSADSRRSKRARRQPQSSPAPYIPTQVDNLGNDLHAPALEEGTSGNSNLIDQSEQAGASSSAVAFPQYAQAPALAHGEDDDEYASDAEMVDNTAVKNMRYIHRHSALDLSQTTPQVLSALGRDKLQELVLPAYRAAGRTQAGTYLLAHWILQADENGKAFRHGLLPDAETLQKMGEETKRDRDRQAARMRALDLVWQEGEWVCEDEAY